MKYYTNERNVQIVIYLLKAHGIHNVIASPGTTNMTFVGSIQNDPWFKIWSCVDERSAAYLACGMASRTNEPVILSCTGATASRNYMSGLTEAFYRKLPVLAITSHRGIHAIGHLLDQQIDRRNIPNDIAIESVNIPTIKDAEDEKYCEIETNKAILSLFGNGSGPVHINLCTTYSKDFSIKALPSARVIRKYYRNQELPELPTDSKIAVCIGAHQPCSTELTSAIDSFCEHNNAVVFCDHTSGYRGKYEVNYALVGSQQQFSSSTSYPDLLIHIGEVSGDPYAVYPTKEVWRVSEDGQLRDRFGLLSKVFCMEEKYFFDCYTKGSVKRMTYYDDCNSLYNEIYNSIPELPFSNIWVAKKLALELPDKCEFHLGILNSLRSYNFFKLRQGIFARCNVGGFGIDGGVSSIVGSSIVDSTTIHIGVFGDLAFFYDMNVLGNRHIGKNLRIILINNGRGTEFRLPVHPCSIFGENADKYMSAAGHFGNKSIDLVKHYSVALGFDYLCAHTKDEFEAIKDNIVSPEMNSKPMLVEIFTDTNMENEAFTILTNCKISLKGAIKGALVNGITKALGESSLSKISKILK